MASLMLLQALLVRPPASRLALVPEREEPMLALPMDSVPLLKGPFLDRRLSKNG
jgi:hypothetical protein